MKELVSESGANLVVASLSIILFILTALIGASRGKLKAGLVTGFVLAAFYLGLWGIFNVIVRATGLDSFWGLVGQVILFAAIGAVIGYVAAKR